MNLTKEKFWQSLNQRQLDFLYLFYSQEEFLIRDGIARIKEIFSSKGDNQLQYHYLFSDEVGFDKLMEMTFTYTFIPTKRLIAYKLTDRPSASDIERIAVFIKRPPEDTIIILIAEDVDFKTPFYKYIRDSTTIVRFFPLFENQIPEWIQKKGAEMGYKITSGAARLMIDFIGQDLSLLVNEMEKMTIYLSHKKHIDIKDVEKAVGKTRVFSVFELTTSLGERNPVKSLKLLRQLIDSGQSPVGIIALVALHFRRIYLIKNLLELGKSQEEISKQLGMSPFILRAYLPQASLFSLKEIRMFFSKFLDTDIRLKSSPLSQSIILETLVFDICS